MKIIIEILLITVSFSLFASEKYSDKELNQILKEVLVIDSNINSYDYKKYITKELYSKIDKDNNGVIEKGEYKKAFLDCDIKNSKASCIKSSPTKRENDKALSIINEKCIKGNWNNICKNAISVLNNYSQFQNEEKDIQHKKMFDRFRCGTGSYDCETKITSIFLMKNHIILNSIIDAKLIQIMNGKSSISINEFKSKIKEVVSVNSIDNRINQLLEIKNKIENKKLLISPRRALVRWIYKNCFHQKDLDYSGFLDVYEFTNEQCVKGDLEEYIDIINNQVSSPQIPHGLISINTFIDLNYNSDTSSLSVNRNIKELKSNKELTDFGVSVDGTEIYFNKVIKLTGLDKNDGTKNPPIGFTFDGPFKQKYSKINGIIFGAVYQDINSEGNSISEIDWDGTRRNKGKAFTLRVIKEFLNNDDEAEAAIVSWSKNAGSSTSPDIDIAIRFDHTLTYNLFDTSSAIAYGIEYQRFGREDDSENLIRYYLLSDIEKNHNYNFIRRSNFIIGPVYEIDRITKIKKITGLLEWEPLLSTKFLSGRNWFIRPKFAIELSDIKSFPPLSENPTEEELKLVRIDRHFYKYTIQAGIKLGKSLSLSYDFTQRHATNDFELDYHLKSASLEWKLMEKDYFSFKVGYEQGKDSPSFEKIEQFKFGLGFKF
jgi:hypothetical protein